MQELVDRISDRVGVDPAVSEKAVSIILNFLKAEAPPEAVAKVFAAMPGAEAVLEAPAAEPGGKGGLLGTIGGLLGGLVGGGMGGIMAAFTMLSDAGLDMGQVQAVVREVVSFSREKAGDELTDEVIGSIPGLAQFAG